MPTREPLIIPVPEAAKRLGIARRTMYLLVTRREIASLQIGRRLFVPVDALTEFVRKRLRPAEGREGT